MNQYLSKSLYCDGIQCPKKLWLKKNKPEVYDTSYDDESVFENGNIIGDLAMGLFGDFFEIPYSSTKNMAQLTKKAMVQNIPIICEASFIYKTNFCSVDILKNYGDMTVEIYEVKSSTKVKDVYIEDLAYQYYLLTKLGYTVKKASLVLVDTNYVRNGDLDLKSLFKIEDITQSVSEKLTEVGLAIERLVIALKQENEPQQALGVHCYKPYECGFFPYCSKGLPKPNVFDLSGINYKKKLDYYHEGLITFEDLLKSGYLKGKAQIQAEHALYQREDICDVDAIRDTLSAYWYPLYFLDFETINPAIPHYDGNKPYDRTVFQYSIHYIEHEGGDLKHLEYLGSHDKDPQPELAKQLCKDIPQNACVLAYNMSFEKGCLEQMATAYPDLANHLTAIHNNIYDLMTIFKNGYYYSQMMEGKYSIKKVLPALFPNDSDLDYKHLEGVQNGQDASNAFLGLHQQSPKEIEKVRAQLLKYCALDTYAMVKIWSKLRSI